MIETTLWTSLPIQLGFHVRLFGERDLVSCLAEVKIVDGKEERKVRKS